MGVREAAAALSTDESPFSVYMVRAEVDRGALPCRRVGRRGLLRFTQADLDAYLERIARDVASGLTPRSARNVARSHR